PPPFPTRRSSDLRRGILTLSVDALLLGATGDTRVRALAVAARSAVVGVRVGIDAGAPARDERGGTRQRAGARDANLTRVAHLAGVPRALPAALCRAAVVAVGIRVHAGVVARDERAGAGDHALAGFAELAGVARHPCRATVFAAAFGRAAVLAAAIRIDARSVA